MAKQRFNAQNFTQLFTDIVQRAADATRVVPDRSSTNPQVQAQRLNRQAIGAAFLRSGGGFKASKGPTGQLILTPASGAKDVIPGPPTSSGFLSPAIIAAGRQQVAPTRFGTGVTVLSRPYQDYVPYPVSSSWILNWTFRPWQGSVRNQAGSNGPLGIQRDGDRGDFVMTTKPKGGRGAREYYFYRVTRDVMDRAIAAPSPGRFYWRELAPRYASYSILNRRMNLSGRRRIRDPRTYIRLSPSRAAALRARPSRPR